MRYIIRSGDAGRHGLFFFMLVLSLTVCLGQEPPAAQKATGTDGAKVEAATQASATPPVPENNPQVAPAAPPKAPEVTAPAVKAPQPAPVSQKKTKGKTPKNSKQAMPTGPGEVTATGVQELPYEIGPEDILYLNVLHQPDVSQQLVVRPDGFVSVRFAGEIKANGLTTQQLAEVVTEKLTQYFNHPEVMPYRAMAPKYSRHPAGRLPLWMPVRPAIEQRKQFRRPHWLLKSTRPKNGIRCLTKSGDATVIGFTRRTCTALTGNKSTTTIRNGCHM